MDNLGVEFDSTHPIRFANAKCYDGKGNILKCSKCDKDAIGSIIGKESFFNFCEDHGMISNYSVEFVYRPPINEK